MNFQTVRRLIPALVLCLSACVEGGGNTLAVDSSVKSDSEIGLDSSVVSSRYTAGFTANNPTTWGSLNCHDPDLFKDGSTYYVFSTDASYGNTWGGGIQVRSSSDLITWTCSSTPAIPGGYWDPDMLSWCGFTKTGTTANGATSSDAYTWAPCVIKLNGKYLMYHGVITDADAEGPRAWIGLAVADTVTGPYKPANLYDSATWSTGTVVRYTWQNSDADGVDSACLNEGNGSWAQGIGTIDPHVVTDASGQMWLNFGSWKGGISILKLNAATGLPLAGAPADAVKGGTGTRITSDYATGPAIEGACAMNFSSSDYYYLFNSNGAVEDGYSVHVSRVAKTSGITGGYSDSLGKRMLSASWSSFRSTGNKFLGSFMLGGNNGWLNPGGQSFLEDSDGRIFMASHTRTTFKASYYFYLQIRQVYFNTDGWPVVNPNEYYGEKLRDMTESEIAGSYQAVMTVRGTQSDDSTATPSYTYALNADGTISGRYTGTWSLGKNAAGVNCAIAFKLDDGVYFRGIVTDAYDQLRTASGTPRQTIAFTAFNANTTGEYFFGNKDTL